MNLYDKLEQALSMTEDIPFKKLVIEKTLNPGDKVEIKWVDRDEVDLGYIFILPEQWCSYDEGDCFINITAADNSDGIGDADMEWVHLQYLLTYDRIEYVKVKSNR